MTSSTFGAELPVEEAGAAPASGPEHAGADGAPTGQRRDRIISVLSRYGTLIFLGVLIVAFTILSEVRLDEQRFFTGGNLSLILRQSAVLAILAAGLTIPLILGEFDLSIAANLTLGGAMFALFLSGDYLITWPDVPFTDLGGGAVLPAGVQSSVIFALLAALAFGILVGLLNGAVVSYLGVSAFIGTLGMAGIVDGYLVRLTDGRSVQLPPDLTGSAQGTLGDWSAPESWAWSFLGVDIDLGRLSIPTIALVAVAVMVALSVFINHTEFGRRMDAVGGNPEAARLSGIRVREYRLAAFVISACVAAVAGMVLAAGRTGSAVTLVGNQSSFLLQAFTACFLGAVTLREGEFHVLGTAIGVLLMTTTFSGLIILGVPGYAQTIANGVILIAALSLAGIARRASGARA
ncbi:MAG: ABC transporter permease [Acidimicrobiales bacterium]